ncbi:hypothetical protein J5491_00275 [Candidatus Saccharibacteria bacterium]|nr:hypothetical protein [Candidatus Saccharibacteria bacterium]
MSREINLVPDIKGEMIKTLKLRNFIFFLCIVVSAASAGVAAIVGTIMLGQQAAVDSNKESITELSKKLNSYSDLDDFLTIKDQLGNINTLTSNKKVLSRTFNILSALIPNGPDTITISELNVNLEGDAPTLTFDAQADAKKDPFIDYGVLESFKKSMEYMRFDYGDYVDKSGNIIPTYCMIENNQDGSFLNDSNKGLYAYWSIDDEGCSPADIASGTSSETEGTVQNNYSIETYDGKKVVRIWRTPQFSDWYKSTPTENQPYMSLDGTISNVEHFDSKCKRYVGVVANESAAPKWEEINDECKLVPGQEVDQRIKITSSSNGKGSDDSLVLRFSATITLNPAVYLFNNHHMIALAPSGHYNVTDSYVQIQSMFGERAADCEEGDTTCDNATNAGADANSKGGN